MYKFSPLTTVHVVARQVRQAAYNTIGEANFAKILLAFDKQVGNDIEVVKAELAKTRVGTITFQLGMCWLDGCGWGEQNFWAVWLSLQKVSR